MRLPKQKHLAGARRPFKNLEVSPHSYYFGGQLINSMTRGGGGGSFQGGLSVNTTPTDAVEPPTFFLFGTEVVSKPSRTTVGLVGVGIDVRNGGKVHIHDGSVRVDVDVEPLNSVNAIGVRRRSGGTVERFVSPVEATTTMGTAYDFDPPEL